MHRTPLHRLLARSLRLPMLVALLLTAACDVANPTESEPDPSDSLDLSWLQANLHPFRTTLPGGDLSDLEPLRAMIGDARVVSLGEATHGTREFFHMKHRVFEYLVREMGFTVFGIEASWGDALDLDRYVTTGEGDPAALLAGLHYWTWNTREVLDMIPWMRSYNETVAPEAQLRFTGFDMQHSARAMDEVTAFVTSVDTGALTVVGPSYGCWRTWEQASTYGGLSANFKNECAEGLARVYDLLESRREEYEAASSPAAYARALRAARVAVQHEFARSRRWVDVEANPREGMMAENAIWTLEQAGPEARMVLWAHNAHVMDVDPWMGHALRNEWGDDMVIAGFSFHQGTLNAFPMQNGEVTGPLAPIEAPAPIPSSYEHVFERLGEPRFFVDLRPLRSAPPAASEWLLGPRPFRAIGAAYDPTGPNQYLEKNLPESFDILLHVRDTNPTELLPFPAR